MKAMKNKDSRIGKNCSGQNNCKEKVQQVVSTAFIFALCITSSIALEAKESPCVSQKCIELLAMYKNNMNDTIDPCDDFYSFACGKFVSKPLADEKSFASLTAQAQDEVWKLLSDALSDGTSGNNIPGIDFLRLLYSKSTNKTLLAKNDLSDLAQLDKQLRHKQTLEELVIATTKKSLNIIFEFELLPDAKNDPSQLVIFIKAGKQTLKKTYLIAEDEEEDDVKAKKVREAYVKLMSSSLKMLHPHRETGQVEQAARKVLDFEIRLTKVPHYYMHGENKPSYKEVRGIKFQQIFSEIFPNETITRAEFQGIKYTEWIIKAHRNEPEVLNDYISWKLMENFGCILSEQYNDAYFEFLAAKDGLKKKPFHELQIVKKINSWAPELMGKLYLQASKFSENEIEAAENMTKQLKESMSKIFNKTQWLDDQSREAVQNKLKQMKINFGYPRCIMDEDKMKRIFNFTFTADDSTLKLMQTLRILHASRVLSKVNDIIDPDQEWPSSVAEINSDSRNTVQVVIPAAMIRAKYNSKLPGYANFADLGFTIAHQIAHGFDDDGIYFAADGHLQPSTLLTRETKNKFSDVSFGLRRQYSLTLDEKTKSYVDTLFTHSGNIADNTALRIAHQTYIDRNENDFAAFDGWSHEQMFFLSFANSHCQASTHEYSEDIIRPDLQNSHTPPQYRVNGPLFNLESFGQAFKCKSCPSMLLFKREKVW